MARQRSFHSCTDCGTRALNDCDIKIGGRVVGEIGTGTKVRANNVQNW